MKDFSLTCSCGFKVEVKADDRDKAIELIKQKMMTQEALDGHWAEMHQNDSNPKPTLDEMGKNIEMYTVEAGATVPVNPVG